MVHARFGLRVFGLVATVALGTALLVGSAGADVAVPVTGVGTGSCHAAGRVTFNPPLATGGTATSETISLRANLVHCTGTGDAVTVRRGTATATVTLATNDCAALAALTSGSLSTTVVWKTTMGSPALVSSTVTFTSGTMGTTASGKPTLSLVGSTTAGSFSGDPAAANVVVSQSLTAIGNACAHGRLRGLTFSAAASTASLG
jgi:hypothetical protein